MAPFFRAKARLRATLAIFPSESCIHLMMKPERWASHLGRGGASARDSSDPYCTLVAHQAFSRIWLRTSELLNLETHSWGANARSHSCYTQAKRTSLKVTDLRWRSPICGFCENHRFSSAVLCSFLHPASAWISRRRGESVKICGFLQKSEFWALSVTWGPCAWARPEQTFMELAWAADTQWMTPLTCNIHLTWC